MSDFDDDEDFGLGASAPQGELHVEPEEKPVESQEPSPQPELPKGDSGDELDDIYGDIAEAAPAAAPRATQPRPAVNSNAAASSRPEAEAAVAERQASGHLAESWQGPSSTALVPAGQPQGTQQGKSQPKKGSESGLVYVGDLHWWTSDADLEKACSEFGPVEKISFFEDKGSGRSKGYATVQFGSREGAEACRQGLNGRLINGRNCVVTLSSSGSSATAAAKGGGRTEPPRQAAVNGGGGRGRGQASQAMQSAPMGGMGWGGMPPMPPWGGLPMMGMGMGMGPGMGGLPMPGMGVPPFMGMGMGMAQPPPGQPNVKRKRH